MIFTQSIKKSCFKPLKARVARPILLALAAGSVSLFDSDVKAFTIQTCAINTSNLCGISGAYFNGKLIYATLNSSLADNVYGSSGQFLDVTTQAQASALMDASADAINAAFPNVSVTLPPPVLFGEAGETEFKIAYEVIFVGGSRYWEASRSRWVDVGGYWQIVRTQVQWPAGQPNTWVKLYVPAPLPILGLTAAYSYLRKARRLSSKLKLSSKFES